MPANPEQDIQNTRDEADPLNPAQPDSHTNQHGPRIWSFMHGNHHVTWPRHPMEDRTFGGRCVATLQQQRSNATGGGEAPEQRFPIIGSHGSPRVVVPLHRDKKPSCCWLYVELLDFVRWCGCCCCCGCRRRHGSRAHVVNAPPRSE
jgi:hypothetical protein